MMIVNVALKSRIVGVRIRVRHESGERETYTKK